MHQGGWFLQKGLPGLFDRQLFPDPPHLEAKGYSGSLSHFITQSVTVQNIGPWFLEGTLTDHTIHGCWLQDESNFCCLAFKEHISANK